MRAAKKSRSVDASLSAVFLVYGSGFRIQNWNLGFRFYSAWFMVHVHGLGFRVEG